jgi:hypothetical protein
MATARSPPMRESRAAYSSSAASCARGKVGRFRSTACGRSDSKTASRPAQRTRSSLPPARVGESRSLRVDHRGLSSSPKPRGRTAGVPDQALTASNDASIEGRSGRRNAADVAPYRRRPSPMDEMHERAETCAVDARRARVDRSLPVAHLSVTPASRLNGETSDSLASIQRPGRGGSPNGRPAARHQVPGRPGNDENRHRGARIA